MSFVLSKLVWGLVAPGSLLFLMILVAWVAARRWPRLSSFALGGALLLSGLLMLTPIGKIAIAPLENRFPPAPPTIQPDGIIVLGGSIAFDAEHSSAQLNGSAERITELVALARRFPDARLVFTGGSGVVRNQQASEAAAVAPLLFEMGVPPSRIVFEGESRNTWENALFTRDLVKPQPGETWLLVTSAWHMPRSMGIFRRTGWNVVAWPVDYRSGDREWLHFDMPNELDALSWAQKEYIGLFAYRLMDRTDALFPAP